MLDVTMQRAQLSVSLKAVRKVIPTRFSLPVITSVKIDATAGGLNLTGTDMDVYLTVTVPQVIPFGRGHGRGDSSTAPGRGDGSGAVAGSGERVAGIRLRMW